MAQKEMRFMMKGAAILTLASFVAKLLSAVYRVPFQNLVGDEGFYVYQQVYPIYGLAMTLGLSGLPQFISKYVAEQSTDVQHKKALKQLMPYVQIVGILLWLLLFSTSGWLASLMGDVSLKPLIQVASCTFLLVPGLACFRGYFQGKLEMAPTAASQVIEQLVRVTIILLAAWFFRQLSWNIYQTGTLAMAGALFGGIMAMLVLMRYDRKLNLESLTLTDFFSWAPPEYSLFRRLLVEGGLVSIYTGYLILFQLVDSFFVKNFLVIRGLSEQAARISKGVYDRGQPLVQLGLVIATALSATFLPALTKYVVKKDSIQFTRTAGIYLRLSTALAAAATIGLALLMPFINFALFKDYSGNLTLIIFVFSVGLMAAIQVYQSIAQSRNIFRRPLWGALLGILVKLLTTGVLTYLLGTAGASLSTLLGLLTVLGYLIHISPKELNDSLKNNHFLFKLCLCLGIMMVVLFSLYTIVLLFQAFDRRWLALVWALTGVVIGSITFIALAVRVKLFSLREWLMFPMGAKILRLMKRG